MQIYDIHINEQKKEVTEHGTYEFPLAVYETQPKKNVLGFVNWHWHRELQLCYVTRGSIIIYVNQKGLILHKGEGIFINSGILHMANHFKDPDSAYICVDFSPSLISGFAGSSIERKYITPFMEKTGLIFYALFPDIPWQKLILDKLIQIYKLYTLREYCFELDICIDVMDIWKRLITQNALEHQDYNPLTALENTRLKTILSYIHEHYCNKNHAETSVR